MTHPKVVNLCDASSEELVTDGARGAVAQALLVASEGTGAFDIRIVRLSPGGVSADHAHGWEQANFVLAGIGEVTLGADIYPVARHDFIYVPPDLRHVFANTGNEELVLLSTLGPKP